MTSFEGKNVPTQYNHKQTLNRITGCGITKTQYNVLGYKVDLHFYDYKLTIKIYEDGNNDRNIVSQIKGQKEIKQKLACKFIRN